VIDLKTRGMTQYKLIITKKGDKMLKVIAIIVLCTPFVLMALSPFFEAHLKELEREEHIKNNDDLWELFNTRG